MRISARSILMAGVTTATVGAVAIAPSVQPAPSPRPQAAPTVQLAAQTVKLPDKAALTTWLAALQRQSPNAAGAVQPVAAAQAAPTAGLFAFPGLGNAIIGAYNFIEPIVAYGVEWAQYLVGWIPFGGLISDQIGIFYYDLIEPIARAITYNIAYWIGGSKSFLEALNDGILESANAGIGFLNAEIRWGWGFLPPLPFGPPQIPALPWFGILQTQTAPTSAAALAPEVGVQNVASDLVDAVYIPVRNTIDYGVSVFQDVLAPIPVVRIVGDQVELLWDNLVQPISNSVVFGAIDPILNAPLNINSYINGVYNVGAATVNSLINTGFAEANYFLGGLPFAASTQESQLNRTAEVSSVPSTVKHSLAPQNKVDETPGPLADVAKTVRNVRTEIRTSFTERDTTDTKQVSGTDAGGNTVVRTRSEARGPLAKAISDVTKGASSGKPDKVATEVANAPRSIVKSLSDTAKKVVKDVREAAKGARDTAKDRPAGEAAE